MTSPGEAESRASVRSSAEATVIVGAAHLASGIAGRDGVAEGWGSSVADGSGVGEADSAGAAPGYVGSGRPPTAAQIAPTTRAPTSAATAMARMG